MIILFQGYGNHSNRLLQNIHFEVLKLEYGVEYINPSFADMHQYYVDPCDIGRQDFRAYLLSISRRTRFLRRLTQYAPNVMIFDQETEKVDVKNLRITKNLLHAGRKIYVAGWHFRVQNLVDKHTDELIRKYTLKKTFYAGNPFIDKLITIKNKNTIIIGMHIRRGDYKHFENGKYCFHDDVYKKYMKTIQDYLEKTYQRKCMFVIFSNEITSFKTAEDIYVSNNAWYIDHLAMSQCDFLIGPPSTFTMWAAFMGRIQYYHIVNASGAIPPEAFARLLVSRL